MVFLSKQSVEYNFNKSYCYKFNLNPDPNKHQQLNKLVDYCKKKGYGLWLVKCESKNGFKHYHGMIHLMNINEDRAQLAKKALNKQINLYIGRSYPLIPTDNISAWYDYIFGESNIVEEDYWYPAVYLHKDIGNKIKRYCLD